MARDYPLIMGVTMMSSVLVVVGNLLADVAYAWVDPRIRYQ
jgi:peptide/nickel transport system permease protein